MKDVFISFSSQNVEEANRVCSNLEQAGISCFIAIRDIAPGQEYAAQLVDQLSQAKILVLVMSKEANESPHVLREIEYCVSHKIPIVVYPLEKVELTKSMEYFLMTHQWLNIDDNNKDQKLVESIKRLLLNDGEEFESDTAKQAYEPKVDEEQVRNEYKEMIRKTKRAYGRAFLIMIFVVILIFATFYVKYILPETKDSGQKVIASTETSVEEKVENKIKLSDRVTLGKYNDAPIEWRVIHINNDGTALLLASQILTIKPFDTAEGGEYNEYDGVDYWAYENRIIDDPRLCILARGNNDWEASNIRTWLNSDRELVEYKDQAPTRKASCTGENFYSNEPGFLYYFSEEEKAVIYPTHNKTLANEFSENPKDGYVDTQDLVFLLSEEELSYLREAGISVYATVTEQAKEKDTSNSAGSFVEMHNIENYYWWLRDHSTEAKTNEGKIVLTEYEDDEDSVVKDWSVGAASFGIRPAITVKLDKLNKYIRPD